MINLNDMVSNINDRHILCGKAIFNLELEKIMVEISDSQH